MGRMLTNGRALPRLFAPTSAEMGQGQEFSILDTRNGEWVTGAALYENGVKLGTLSGSGSSITGDIRSFVKTKGTHQLHAAFTGSAMGESEKTAFSDTVELWAVNVTCSHCHIVIDGGSYGTADGFMTYRKPEESEFYLTITAVPDAGFSMNGGSLTVNGVSGSASAGYSFDGGSFAGDTITVTAAAQPRGGIRLGNLTDSRIDGYIEISTQDRNGIFVSHYLFEENGSIGIFTGAPDGVHQRVSVINPYADIYVFYIIYHSGYSGSYSFTMNGQLIENSNSGSVHQFLYTGAVEFTKLYQTAT